MDEFSLSQRMTAEFLGTLWLVLGGCGSAVLAAAFAEVGIGLLGVAFAFGLSVLTMVYAVGHVSGGHFNPAVTVGLCTARAPQALAGVAIGLALTLIHLVSIPVTNTSVNPARSTGPGHFCGRLGH